MARRSRLHRYIPPKQPSKRASPTFIMLDQFSVSDIGKWAAFKDRFLKYYWDYHNALAYQRSHISDEIRKSLLGAAQRSFLITRWQRAVKYRYALKPLSTAGSLVDPGGRFNVGDINPSQFPPFPCLYLAADKKTALQELLSQKIDENKAASLLDPFDLALTSKDSVAVVSLSGSLASVINLKEPKKLQVFVDLIKGFTISDELIKVAKSIGQTEPELIRTVPKLMDSLLDPNWRLWPMQFDVPVASQIFGQLVADAGIEAILYTSKFTGQDCLAVFPQNFDAGSFIELDDPAPSEVKIRRLDAGTWPEIQKM